MQIKVIMSKTCSGGKKKIISKLRLIDYELGNLISVLELMNFGLHHWDLSTDEELSSPGQR